VALLPVCRAVSVFEFLLRTRPRTFGNSFGTGWDEADGPGSPQFTGQQREELAMDLGVNKKDFNLNCNFYFFLRFYLFDREKERQRA